MPHETYEGASQERSWDANVKRTYDEYQDISLERARLNNRHAEQVSNLAVQALQNAVETANLISKQAVRHADLAIDRQWNIDEVAQLVARTPVFLDAISAAVAAAVQAHLERQHQK